MIDVWVYYKYEEFGEGNVKAEVEYYDSTYTIDKTMIKPLKKSFRQKIKRKTNLSHVWSKTRYFWVQCQAAYHSSRYIG